MPTSKLVLRTHADGVSISHTKLTVICMGKPVKCVNNSFKRPVFYSELFMSELSRRRTGGNANRSTRPPALFKITESGLTYVVHLKPCTISFLPEFINYCRPPMKVVQFKLSPKKKQLAGFFYALNLALLYPWKGPFQLCIYHKH